MHKSFVGEIFHSTGNVPAAQQKEGGCGRWSFSRPVGLRIGKYDHRIDTVNVMDLGYVYSLCRAFC